MLLISDQFLGEICLFFIYLWKVDFNEKCLQNWGFSNQYLCFTASNVHNGMVRRDRVAYPVNGLAGKSEHHFSGSEKRYDY